MRVSIGVALSDGSTDKIAPFASRMCTGLETTPLVGKGVMEWSAKVEELLQTSLNLGVELKNFKTTAEEKLRQESHQLDEKLDASSNELKCLQEESDGLFARSMGFSEEVQALKDAQTTQFSQVDEEIEKEGIAVVQIGGSLTRLCDALMIKKDPDAQFFTPPVTFTLDNFHERKDNNDFWLSPYFYSHKYGYKMQLKVFPNGTGEGAGTHISVFVLIVPGEFDDLLAWPFCGIVTVYLINQRKNGPSVAHNVCYTSIDNLCYRERPRRDDVDDANRMGWGTFKLIAHAELGEGAGVMEEREYLRNNCLSFFVWNITTFTQHH